MSPLAHALLLAGIVVVPWGLFVLLAALLPEKMEKIR